jgi:hypothetical protein
MEEGSSLGDNSMEKGPFLLFHAIFPPNSAPGRPEAERLAFLEMHALI